MDANFIIQNEQVHVSVIHQVSFCVSEKLLSRPGNINV